MKIIAMQLKDSLTRLRDMPRTVNLEMAICNRIGEACRDPCIRGECFVDCLQMKQLPAKSYGFQRSQVVVDTRWSFHILNSTQGTSWSARSSGEFRVLSRILTLHQGKF